MYAKQPLLSPNLKQAHEHSWLGIGTAGALFTGAQRVEFVRIAREALDCELCAQRKAALSPNIDGEHDGGGDLDPAIVDAIHRIRIDPGRLTRAWFDQVTSTLTQAEYVELVSVVTSAVIIDTLHNALGLGVPTLPRADRSRPSRQINAQAVDAGAWLPILAAPTTMSDTGLPQVPNIARSLGLVPSALDLFFNTFRPHYALANIPLSISQGQAEFVAARVSAMNECFY